MTENTNPSPTYRPTFNGYLAIGKVLGAISGAITFIGGWIYCVTTYGFLLGGSLGWFPSALAAVLVGSLVMFLWGPFAIAALIGVIAYSFRGSQPQTGRYPDASAASDAAAAATDASAAADAAANDATVAANAAAMPNVNPPPPSISQAERAVRRFQERLSSSGVAGVISATMDCYSKLGRRSSWTDWDFCAALDQLGTNSSAQAQRAGGAAVEFFEQSSTARRQMQAASDIGNDASLNQDRVAALKTIVDQAIADVAAQPSSAENPDKGNGQGDANLPSFDCSRVQKQNLKLICSTPKLAEADRQLAAAYGDALRLSPTPMEVRDSQRAWIRKRDAAADVNALGQLYASRTEQLRSIAGQGAN
jgi:uncharacterized protein YecT (DUF1311 family)